MACCFDCILQSGGGSGLSAQIGALQQSWRANAPADFARVKFCAGAVAVRYAHLAATAINMRTGGGKCYPLPVAPVISRFADSAVLLKRRPKTLPQLPRGSVYIIYESIQRLEA